MPKSVGNGMTFKRDIETMDDLKKGLLALSDCITFRMKKKELLCCGISISVKDTNFKTVSKQKNLDFPTSSPQIIYNEATSLVSLIWNGKKPLRSLTVTGFDIIPETDLSQMSFLEDGRQEKRAKVESAVKKVRKDFGKSSILYAGVLNNDLGIII